MSESCPRPVQVCDEQSLAEGTPAECPDWEICLPWGGRLYQHAGCVRHEPGSPPPDGVYGTFTLQNGCFVAVAPEEVAKYQSDPCAPVPCPCDSEEGGGASNLCNPSATSGNLYECDAAGRPLVRAYVTGGTGATVTGLGTANNPFVVNIDPTEAGVMAVTSGSAVIGVSTSSRGVVTVTHAEGWNEHTINGMRFDAFGHLEGYEEPEAGTNDVTGIVGTGGITAENNRGIVTVQLENPVNAIDGTYLFGGYNVTFDNKNMVFNVEQEVLIPEGTYAFGPYDVTLNESGSIIDFENTNNLGAMVHELVTVEDGDAAQITCTFTLRTTTRIIIDIEGELSADMAEGITFRVDGDPQTNTRTLLKSVASSTTTSNPDGTTSSTPSTYYVHIRLMPSGYYQSGEHTLNLRCAGGFPLDTQMLVSVRAVQFFNGVSFI